MKHVGHYWMKTMNTTSSRINLRRVFFLAFITTYMQVFSGQVMALSTTQPPANHQLKKPTYVTEHVAADAIVPLVAPLATPVIRVYQDSIPFFGEGRDQATLLALGQVLGENYFVHLVSDLSAAAGIPAGTSAVLITSNGAGFSDTATAENDPAAQANLDAFVQAGGTLIVDMADNLEAGGFIAPGAVGTPDFIFPFPEDGNATLAPAALGHPIINGPDGSPGTEDDLTGC